MTLLDLLRTPQRYIAAQVDGAPHHWLVPICGYAGVALAEGHHRMVARFPASPPAVVLVVALAFAATLGACMWALTYGGALHLGARVLGGRPGLGASCQAVGYALFWPGLLSATSAVALTYSSEPITYVVLAANLIGGGWGLFTVVGAVRTRHAFSWARAVAAWVFTFAAAVAFGIALFFVLGRIAAV